MKTKLRTTIAILIAGWTLSTGPVNGEPFGKTRTGEDVQIYTLKNDAGDEARITNYGGILVSLKAPDKNGHLDDVVLGFDKLDGYLDEDYLNSIPYFGATIGRYANRIGKAQFTLDGKTYHLTANNGANTLHGGKRGFEQHVWTAHAPEGQPGVLELSYVSADGEEGFPGKVTAHVRYTLMDRALKIEFDAVTDQPTVVNLTNHTYFNLKGAGNGDILGHEVQIEADAFTPTDAESIPLPGGPVNVAGTPFDFTKPTRIGARIGADDIQLKYGSGYDHNFVLRGGPERTLRRIATVTEPTTGRSLEVESDQPGVQFYTGNFLDGTLTGKNGKVYPYRGGFCLEPQYFPDSPNRPDFPSAVLRPGETYRHTIIYRFGVVK